MKNVFFSIITCTKNSEKYILRNIESVSKQIFKDYEQIFIDGKSNDKTQKIINKFSKKDPKKYKFYSLLPTGVSDAFNEGIKKSHGKYIFFLNSDDYFYNTRVLRDVHDFLVLHNDLDWIYGKISAIEEDERFVGIFPLWKIFQISNSYLLKFINFIPHQSVFMKKNVFCKFGYFDPKLKLNMDTEFFLRISNKTKWIFFDRIISNYTLRSGSLSSNIRNKGESLRILEKVQKKYLSGVEMPFAFMLNRLVAIYNKTYR